MEAAIGLDRRGRHYFVSVDGLRYRHVSQFPHDSDEARVMFGEADADDQSKLELVSAYGEIAFLPMNDPSRWRSPRR